MAGASFCIFGILVLEACGDPFLNLRVVEQVDDLADVYSA